MLPSLKPYLFGRLMASEISVAAQFDYYDQAVLALNASTRLARRAPLLVVHVVATNGIDLLVPPRIAAAERCTQERPLPFEIAPTEKNSRQEVDNRNSAVAQASTMGITSDSAQALADELKWLADSLDTRIFDETPTVPGDERDVGYRKGHNAATKIIAYQLRALLEAVRV